MEEYFTLVSKYRGTDDFLDRKLKLIDDNKNAVLEDTLSVYQNLHGSFERLISLLDSWNSYRNKSPYREAISFLQHLTDEMASQIPSKPTPMVLLSDTNFLIQFPVRKGFEYFIECSYLLENSFAGSSALAHEVGHILCREFLTEENRIRQALELINKPVIKKMEEINLELSSRVRMQWIDHWLQEFVADAYSVALLGPSKFVVMKNSTNRFEIPWEIGTITHPPMNIRLSLMKNRLVKYLREESFNSDSIKHIEDWTPQQRNMMATRSFLHDALSDERYSSDGVQSFIDSHQASPIPNKLAFDKKILRAMETSVDIILGWGSVGHNFHSISQARQDLLEKKLSKESKIATFAALLDITQGQFNSDLEEFLLH